MKLSPTFKAKIIILGEGGVGKTTLAKSFEKDTIFESTTQTIGVEIHVKHLNILDLPCVVQLWDLGGQTHFKNMGVFDQFCKNAQGALACFDLTDMETFTKLREWINFLPIGTPFILVGTKADLNQEDFVLDSDIEMLNEKYPCIAYIKTRIDEYSTIKAAFNTLLQFVFERNANQLFPNIPSLNGTIKTNTDVNSPFHENKEKSLLLSNVNDSIY